MSIIKYREDLHKIPERSNYEFKTSDYLFNHLNQLNCTIERVGTSLIAYFDFNQAETIAYRSDIDALIITEVNEVPYKSIHTECMHACGHDGHMAMLLTFADYLSQLETCKYNVVCIFQAAEEVIMGARAIIKSNVLNKYNLKAIFGFHVWPKLEEGVIFTRANELMAMACEIDLKITGKAIHIADFQKGIDSIKVMNSILNDIYQYESSINESHLLQFGQITGGTIRNIIANETVLSGSMRCYDLNVFKTMQKKIREICSINCAKYNANFEIIYGDASAPVINNPNLISKLNIDFSLLHDPVLQAEDFGEYCSNFPAVFFFLGLGDVPALHTNNFDFDSTLLKVGFNAYKKLLEIEL